MEPFTAPHWTPCQRSTHVNARRLIRLQKESQQQVTCQDLCRPQDSQQQEVQEKLCERSCQPRTKLCVKSDYHTT